MLNLDEYVIDVLMRDLVGHDRRPASFFVYVWLTAQQARSQGPVQVSYQELAESVGLSKSSAQAAVSWLVRRKLLAASKENSTAIPYYTVRSPLEGCCTLCQSPPQSVIVSPASRATLP